MVRCRKGSLLGLLSSLHVLVFFLLFWVIRRDLAGRRFLIFMASDPNFDIETPRHFENDANIAKQCDRMANQSHFAAFHWVLSNYHGGFSLA